MPRIWLDYCEFLVAQGRITRTRRTFDRALRALPITQHHRLWPLYLSFVRRYPLPETAVRVYRRYLKGGGQRGGRWGADRGGGGQIEVVGGHWGVVGGQWGALRGIWGHLEEVGGR